MKHRILFYSHDSFGLGHFRRSLTIASFLARHVEGASILMLTGIESAAAFEKPKGIDFVKLPAIWKSGPDQYRSRHLRVSFGRVLRMRENLIRTVTRAFDPKVVVADNVPRGVDGELVPTLRHLRKHHPHTCIAPTLRDVLDPPGNIAGRWHATGVYDALRRFYSGAAVAGGGWGCDPGARYRVPAEVGARAGGCGQGVRCRGRCGDARQQLHEPARPLRPAVPRVHHRGGEVCRSRVPGQALPQPPDRRAILPGGAAPLGGGLQPRRAPAHLAGAAAAVHHGRGQPGRPGPAPPRHPAPQERRKIRQGPDSSTAAGGHVWSVGAFGSWQPCHEIGQV